MKNVVYIDVLIFENFFMNYLLLYSINRFCRLRAKGYRIAAAAFAGALYVLVVFIPELSSMFSMIMKFIVSLLMITISFSPGKLRDFIKITVLFYIEAFTMGGVIFGLFYFTNQQIDSVSGTFMINGLTANYIIFGSIVAIILIKFGFDYFDNYYSVEKNRIKLQIILESRSCTVNALIDTGNSLRDPLTNEPVVIVYSKFIEELMPEDLRVLKTSGMDGTRLCESIITSSLKNRIRLIPFRALGVESGMLTAIKVDTIVVECRGKASVIQKPVIALYNKPISSSGDYQALAYPEILK